MAYVIIHGRGLAGLALGDPSDGATVRGVGGRSLGVRGMQHSDAGLPRSALAGLQGPLKITVEHDGIGSLRHRAGLPLMSGLGAVEVASVPAGLDQLVATAQVETAKIVESAGLLSRIAGGPQRWAASVVNYTQSVRATLTAQRNGQPFYVREPEAAAKILSTASRELRAMVEDFRAQTDALVPGTMTASFDMIITGVVNGLVRAASTAVRAAVEEAGKLPPLPGGLPGWVAPVAGLLVVAVVAKMFL